MSVAFSMAVLDEAVEPVPEMTEVVKGQKRRMKRNNGSRPDHLRLYATTEGSALNPQLQMRSRLVHDGYSEAEVDSALEEMWEQNLQYDDFAEVLAYLRSRNAVKDQSDSLHPFPPEEETKTASTAESTSTSTNDRQSSNGDVNGMECGETEGAIESTLFANDAERLRLTRQRKSTHPLNMFSKLDLVADYENLADAAFAVSEWVAKAADRDEVCAPFFSLSSVYTCLYKCIPGWDTFGFLGWLLFGFCLSDLYASFGTVTFMSASLMLSLPPTPVCSSLIPFSISKLTSVAFL
jgi:hypothetical protein